MPNQTIREEIRKKGAITFARFMELALYCPETGYYETKKDKVGRGGDFITSVSVGKLFGELLAFQFAEWLRESEISGLKFQIVEAGAHDAKLANDILNWLQQFRPQLFARIEYWILEPSFKRKFWQKETLADFDGKVFWTANLSELKNRRSAIGDRQFHGIIFSNELLDAFPVHRFGWDAKNKAWFEFGVALENEKFVWTKISDSQFPTSILQLPFPLLEVLPDGYVIETSPAAENWWRAAANFLGKGKLLTIDYGLAGDELVSPARTNGTLRAYFKHHVSHDLLANAGEQDLTAHVNFSAIQKIGEAAGLQTEFFSTQTKFLTQILEKIVRDKNFGEWDASRARQFQTLTHPEHLGCAFRVLVQGK